MKKILALVVLMLLAASCVSATYPAGPPLIIMGPQGRPLPGATVTITLADGTDVTTYKDRAGTTTWASAPSLPSTGLLQFFGAANDYKIIVSGGGYTYTLYATIFTDEPAGTVTDADFTGVGGILYEVSSGVYTVLKTTRTGTAAPDPNDDTTDGWVIGSIWIDTLADKSYIALDVTNGAAVWKEITQGGIASLNGETGSTQTFAYSATGTGPTWTSSSNVHTLEIPDAGASVNRGLITNASQTIAGTKLFTGSFGVSNNTTLNATAEDKDTVIRGDSDVYLFVADAGNDRVGIGDYTPDAKLGVVSDTVAGDGGISVEVTNAYGLYVHRDSTTTTDPLIDIRELGDQTQDVIYVSVAGASASPLTVYNSTLGTNAFTLSPLGIQYNYYADPNVVTYGCSQDTDTGIGFSGSNEVYLLAGGSPRLEVTTTTVNVTGELSVSGVTGTGKVVCVKSDGNLGVCSDQPDASGECTCG